LIIETAPLRVGFFGGGSDLNSYLDENGHGQVLNCAINKHVYVLVKKRHDNKIYLKYSENEEVSCVNEIKHDFIREALKYLNIDYGLEIINWADIPTKGTGLGSSSSFLVALLLALHNLNGELVSADTLAKEACDIEIFKCKKPIGYQDQYAAAFGGLNVFTFDVKIDGEVKVHREKLNHVNVIGDKLFNHIILFYTGKQRNSDAILSKQSENLSFDEDIKNNMLLNIDLVTRAREYIHIGRFNEFGKLIDENWKLKKTFNSNISSEEIDNLYYHLKNNGVSGGKITGAGGGGYLVLYVPIESKFRVMNLLESYSDFGDGCRIMDADIDQYGARVIFREDENEW
jgi:D-glycero-alpha-D-manno-heptose-7-phosphate kinase